MIVPIPGEKDCMDRMVASRSGQVPHIVRAVKKGVFKCDGQCQMHNTHKICAHVIAVAEVHSKLTELLSYHSKGCFDPNLSSMVLIGMPSTSGKKPGQKPGTKRKRTKKQDNPKVTSEISRFAGTTVAISVSASSTITSTATTVSTTKDHPSLYSRATTSSYSSVNYPGAYDYTYSCPPYPCAPPYTPSGSYYGYQFPHSNYSHHGFYDSYNTPTSTSPFTAKFITGRISKCQGCGNKFRDVNPELQPPYDLVVARLECRPYFSKQKNDYITPKTPSNSHYHADMLCIRSADPSFQGNHLIIQVDVQNELLPIHKDHMRRQFGINL